MAIFDRAEWICNCGTKRTNSFTELLESLYGRGFDQNKKLAALHCLSIFFGKLVRYQF